jgi:uncharacterized protein YbjT (DUF2867 family)
MKLTIFGATGATGTSLARQALADRGLASTSHTVTIDSRTPPLPQHAQLTRTASSPWH